MKTNASGSRSRSPFRYSVGIVMCAVLLVPIGRVLSDRKAPAPLAPIVAAAEDARIPSEQLDSLVAPIALYPDPLLSQTLVASTYPLEIMQLQQWLDRNKNLKDKALADAVAKQPWDPSIQAMAALPDVVKRLADDIQWATELGNAFLAQQSDVMDAVQRMRQKAQGTGALQTGPQQKVDTQVVEGKTVIVVEQADAQVVYVPSYDPMIVYGEPLYPYPSIYYPPYAPGIVAASAISFGVGWAMGAAWGGGGWGWGCGWGHNDININNNNFFNRNTNISGGNRINNIGNRGGGNTWRHNPQHRGGAPYRDRTTADRFGGTARGDSLANRKTGARQQIDRQGGKLGSADRARNAGFGDGNAGRGDRAGGLGDNSRAGSASDRARSGVAGDRATLPSAGDRSSGFASRTKSGGGGSDRIGGRDIGRSSGSGGKGAFGSGGFSGSSARSSSSRGRSSFGGSRGGGGFSRGGGGRRR